MFRLDGKIALITGAAGEIGSAIVRLFDAQGATVAGADLREDLLDVVLKDAGPSTSSHSTDLSTAHGCHALIEEVTAQHGRLDVLVNCAGICPRIPFLDATEEDWEKIVAVNQKSMFFCSQAAAAHLRASKGRIVSLASYAGRAGAAAHASIYSGTKGAVIAMTKAIARELAPDVLVNAVAPGAIDTAMVNVLPPRRLKRLVQNIPLQRLGRVDEVAEAVLFLSVAGYITGATIDVNGGWTMV